MSIEDLTKRWSEFKMSNFAYLMHLNVLAGRSFDDVAQYPFFPNLFADGDRDLARGCLAPASPEMIVRVLARLGPFTAKYFETHGRDLSKIVCSFEELANAELPAEFFFQPELFADSSGLGLPEFRLNESRHDFVYRQRKVLEDDRVSSQLHHWIDSVFGTQQNENTRKAVPLQLFSNPHIARPPRETAETHIFTHSVSVTSVMFAGRVASGDIWLVDTQGGLQGFKIDMSGSSHVLKVETVPLPHCRDALFSITEDGILTYERHMGRLRFSGGSARFDGELCDVDELVSCGANFVTVRNRTVVTLFRLETFPTPIASVANTEEVVLCLAISQTFHMLCTATRDDRLHIFSLKNLHQTHSVVMPKSSARGIVVTPTWGFIAVDLGSEILLFSINAECLTSYAHGCQFSYITAVAAPNDIDYIVFVDVKGSLMMFEAYRPGTCLRLAELVSPVCFIDYERERDRLVVVSTSGKIMLIIHPFTPFFSSP
jgi:hypothetical protein